MLMLFNKINILLRGKEYNNIKNFTLMWKNEEFG